MINERYLTKKELSEKLKVSEMTIYRLMKNGMPVIYVGGQPRFNFEEVDKWLRERGK